MRQRVVLLVDDEPTIRSLVKAVLQLEGFETIEAGDGIEAFDLIQEFGKDITLLLTDVKMPRMDGISLAESARELFPRMPVLFMSGYADRTEKLLRRSLFLAKPFRTDALVAAVQKVIATDATEL